MTTETHLQTSSLDPKNTMTLSSVQSLLIRKPDINLTTARHSIDHILGFDFSHNNSNNNNNNNNNSDVMSNASSTSPKSYHPSHSNDSPGNYKFSIFLITKRPCNVGHCYVYSIRGPKRHC